MRDDLLRLADSIDGCVERMRPGLSLPGDPGWHVEKSRCEGALGALHYLMEANAPTIAQALRHLAAQEKTDAG